MYSALTPKSAPFERINIDRSDIAINPTVFLSSKKLPTKPKSYKLFKYLPNGMKDSAKAII